MGYTPLLCSPWSALSTVDEGQRCGCGLIGYWAFGDFTLDTIDAKSGSESAFGKVARQKRQVCIGVEPSPSALPVRFVLINSSLIQSVWETQMQLLGFLCSRRGQ